MKTILTKNDRIKSKSLQEQVHFIYFINFILQLYETKVVCFDKDLSYDEFKYNDNMNSCACIKWDHCNGATRSIIESPISTLTIQYNKCCENPRLCIGIMFNHIKGTLLNMIGGFIISFNFLHSNMIIYDNLKHSKKYRDEMLQITTPIIKDDKVSIKYNMLTGYMNIYLKGCLIYTYCLQKNERYRICSFALSLHEGGDCNCCEINII